MTYRGAYKRAIEQTAGQTVVWQKWVSASNVDTEYRGINPEDYYIDYRIRAYMKTRSMNDVDLAVGQVPIGRVTLVSDAPVTNHKDRILWNGVPYHPDSDSFPSRINGMWMTELTRGET